MKIRKIIRALLSTAVLSTGITHAVVVNVDFGAAAGSDYTGVGVAPDLGTTWNYFNSGAPGALINIPTTALVNSAGVASGVSLATGTTNQRAYSGGGGGNLLVDYLYNQNATSTINLSGLTPNAAFSLYLYGNGDNTTQASTFTLNAANGGATGSTVGSNKTDINLTYVKLNGTADGSGNVSFSWTAAPSTSAFGPFNGFQLDLNPPTDVTPPTLVSFEHNKGAGPILVNEPVIYTVTFSEPMAPATVNMADFGNASATAMTITSVAPTPNPAVFTVVATPSEAGTLQLQINSGATLTDIASLALVTTSAIPDDSTLTVNDLPKTATTTTVASSDTSSTYGQTVTFTATVSPIPSGGTVQFYNGVDDLGTAVTVNTSTGEASYSTNTLTVGSYDISAEYGGNFAFEASSTTAPVSQVVDKAPLTVRATSFVRPTNTANPDPLPYAIFGYQNGENLATSGVTGIPILSTIAVTESPADDYAITCDVSPMTAANYSFTPENGLMTVAVPVPTTLVPGGDFQMYKPGTSYYVKAEFTSGAAFARGVGNGITLAGGTVTYADTTVGNTVDLPGWEPLHSGNDLLPNGVGGSTGMNIFGSWGGQGRIQTAGSLLTITAGQSITITAMIGGPDDGPISGPLAFHLLADGVQLVPTSVVNPTLPNGGAFQMISRTYSAAVLAPHVGKPTKIVLGVEDTNSIGNRVIFDDVRLETTAAPANTFTSWAATNAPGQTPDQDYDNDGVDNGVEYFMGQTGSSFTAMPSLDGSNTIAWTMDANYQGTYEVQTSPDLVNWTNVDPKPAPSGGTLSYTLPPGALGGKSFVRLLVTPTP
jgi:Bacterial Ig-like domain (group 3)